MSAVTEKSNFFTDLRIARALDQMEFRNRKGELITITPEQRKKIIDIVKQHGYSAELINYFKKIGIPEYEPDEQQAEFLFKLDPEIRKKHKTVQDFMRSQDYLSYKAQSAPAKKKIDHFHPYTRAQYAQGIGDMQLRNRKGELTPIPPEQIEQILDIVELHGFGAELEKYLKKINVIGKYATVESLSEAPANTITPELIKKIWDYTEPLGSQIYRFYPRPHNPSPDKITGEEINKTLDMARRLRNRIYQLYQLSQKEASANTITPEQIKKILDYADKLSSQIYQFAPPPRNPSPKKITGEEIIKIGDMIDVVSERLWRLWKFSQQLVNSSVDNTPSDQNKNTPTDLNRMRKLAGLQEKPANKPIMINGKPVDVDSIELDIGAEHGGRDSEKDAARESRAVKAFFMDGTELSDAELEMLNRQYDDVIYDMAYDEIIDQDYEHLFKDR